MGLNTVIIISLIWNRVPWTWFMKFNRFIIRRFPSQFYEKRPFSKDIMLFNNKLSQCDVYITIS